MQNITSKEHLFLCAKITFCGVLLCNGTPLPSQGAFSLFIFFFFTHIFFFLSLFSLIFDSNHCYTYTHIFLVIILLELIFSSRFNILLLLLINTDPRFGKVININMQKIISKAYLFSTSFRRSHVVLEL